MAEAELRFDDALKAMQDAQKNLAALLKEILKKSQDEDKAVVFQKNLEALEIAIQVEIPKHMAAASKDYQANKAQQRAKGQQLHRYITTKLKEKKDIKPEKRAFYMKLAEEMRLNFS